MLASSPDRRSTSMAAHTITDLQPESDEWLPSPRRSIRMHCCAHQLAEYPRQRISRSAGCEGHIQGNRAIGKSLDAGSIGANIASIVRAMANGQVAGSTNHCLGVSLQFAAMPAPARIFGAHGFAPDQAPGGFGSLRRLLMVDDAGQDVIRHSASALWYHFGLPSRRSGHEGT